MMVYGTEAPMGWKFQADLPECIVGVEYAENNHHIKLINKWGQEYKVDADALVKYTCDKCSDELFTRSNHGDMRCPLCGGTLHPVWGKAQLSFVPQQESDFKSCIEPEEPEEPASSDDEATDPQRPNPLKQ